MGSVDTLFEDRWGACIDRPDDGFIEIRWFDTTDELGVDDFKDWLTRFAGAVVERRRPGVLVDATSFKMPPGQMDAAWRDANIIPRYNEAGVRRFAFHMPAGMPAIGAEPSPEGPARFPTGYFGSRRDAITWLADD